MNITSNWIMENVLSVDGCSKHKGVFTARRGYFYTHGGTAEKFRDKIVEALPGANVIDYGDHYASFRGGASLSKQSHWWVKFTLDELPEEL
jgi:hypothetical protein